MSDIPIMIFPNSSKAVVLAGPSQIIKHGTAIDRDKPDQHPIAAITGLQAALDVKVDDAQVGQPNGVAALDADGKVPAAQLPPPPAAGVSSVNGETGDVTLSAADVGADSAGTATSAISAHVAATDPHAQYRKISTPISYTDLTNKPTSMTPTAHAASHGNAGSDKITLATSQVTGLDAALASKLNTSLANAPGGYAALDGGAHIVSAFIDDLGPAALGAALNRNLLRNPLFALRARQGEPNYTFNQDTGFTEKDHWRCLAAGAGDTPSVEHIYLGDIALEYAPMGVFVASAVAGCGIYQHVLFDQAPGVVSLVYPRKFRLSSKITQATGVVHCAILYTYRWCYIYGDPVNDWSSADFSDSGGFFPPSNGAGYNLLGHASVDASAATLSSPVDLVLDVPSQFGSGDGTEKALTVLFWTGDATTPGSFSMIRPNLCLSARDGEFTALDFITESEQYLTLYERPKGPFQAIETSTTEIVVTIPYKVRKLANVLPRIVASGSVWVIAAGVGANVSFTGSSIVSYTEDGCILKLTGCTGRVANRPVIVAGELVAVDCET